MKNNNHKKGMTVDDLAEIIARTLPTKEDMNGVKGEMRSGFTGINKRLDKIELRLEALEERMDEVEKRLDRIEYSIIKKQEKRIERIESELERVKRLLPA